MITKVINVNLHQPIYERLTAKQGDIASRYLLFHLLDGDKPFDLTNRTVRVYAIKPDKTEIFNDLTINDASKGYCTLELTSQCLASAGVVKMELYISESGKVLTSIPFELEVIPCINNDNSVNSTNEFSALEVALGSLQDYYNLRSEIAQARKGHETVGERLDTIENEMIENIEKIQPKPFKPNFATSVYWGEVSDTTGGCYTSSFEKMQSDIKKWVAHGIDNVILIFHIGYNTVTNEIFIGEDVNKMYEGALECLKYGMKINAIKVHCMKCEKNDILTYGIDNFKVSYENLLLTIMNRFNSLDIKYFVPFNEVPHIYTELLTDFTCQMLTLCKDNGYLTGVSCKGTEDAFKIPSVVMTTSDVILINYYKSISNKKEQTTIEDSINSWYSSDLLSWVRHFKNKYNRNVIISETGVKDYWESLIKPETSFDDAIKFNGAVQKIYWEGAFDYLNDNNLTELWQWFGVVDEYSLTVPLFRYFLRGETK